MTNSATAADLNTPTQPPASSSRARRIALRLGPPAIAFCIARALLWRAATVIGLDPLAATTWGRWDTAHYLSIAERGYEFFSCARLPGYDPTQSCGNAAWLPAFPYLIRIVSAFHISPVLSGALISSVFAFGTLSLLWNFFLGPDLSSAGLLTLALAALFPGQVYDHAVFPLSLCAFFQVAALCAYTHRRFVWAGVFGAIAAFSYSSGMFLAGVFGLHHLIAARKRLGVRELAQTALLAGLVALGFAAVLLLHWIQIGHWNAYFLVQEKYHYHLVAPWIRIIDSARAAIHQGSHATEWQTCFVAVLASSLLLAAARKPRSQLDGLLALFVLVYWCVPLMLGTGYVAVYRGEVALLPSVPLAKKLPVWLIAVFVVVAFLLAQHVGLLFFKNKLA